MKTNQYNCCCQESNLILYIFSFFPCFFFFAFCCHSCQFLFISCLFIFYFISGTTTEIDKYCKVKDANFIRNNDLNLWGKKTTNQLKNVFLLHFKTNVCTCFKVTHLFLVKSILEMLLSQIFGKENCNPLTEGL